VQKNECALVTPKRLEAALMADQLFDKWPLKYEQWFQTPLGRLVKSIELGHIMDLVSPGRSSISIKMNRRIGRRPSKRAF
jgi:hypothetical protein